MRSLIEKKQFKILGDATHAVCVTEHMQGVREGGKRSQKGMLPHIKIVFTICFYNLETVQLHNVPSILMP